MFDSEREGGQFTVSPEGNTMKPRYYPRAVVQGSAVFAGEGRTGEGTVLDLTVPGCLIDSPCPPHKGDSLELCLDLPHWSSGSQVGVFTSGLGSGGQSSAW